MAPSASCLPRFGQNSNSVSPTVASAALDLIEHDDLAAARRVVSHESRALARLAGALTVSFVEATELLAATRGRIVLSGMGKSGHIANKIAATFASTGAPALFVPPGGGEPRRSRHDHRGRCAADALEFGRDAGTRGPGELRHALPHPARRHRGAVAEHAGRRGHRRAGPAERAGGRHAWPRADDIHHHDAGAGRCAGGRPAGTQGTHGRGLQALPPRRQARPAAGAGRRYHARGRRPAARPRRCGDGGCLDRDDGEAPRLRWALPTRMARWSAS